MKGKIRSILSMVLAFAVLMSAFTVATALGATAEGAMTDTVFLNFSEEAQGEGNAVESLVYDNGSVTLTSTDTPQNYSKGEYIQQSFNLGDDAQAALAEVQSDRATKRIAVDVTLTQAEAYRWTEVVNAADVQIVLYGKTAAGNDILTKSSKFLNVKEGPATATIILDIPVQMSSVDSVLLKFENNANGMNDEGKGLCNVVATFSAMKVYSDPDGVQSYAGAEGCVLDFSSTMYGTTGSGVLMMNGLTSHTKDETIFAPVGAMHIESTPAMLHPAAWSWEDVGVQFEVKPGSFTGYDGFEFYLLVGEDDTWAKQGVPAEVTCSFQTMAPSRNEDGEYVNADNEVVETAAEALVEKEYFGHANLAIYDEAPEGLSDVIVKGTIVKVRMDFDDFYETEPYPEVSMYPWPNGAGEAYEDGHAYAIENIFALQIARGTMTTGNTKLNFSFGDVYGYKEAADGSIISTMPEIGSTPPDPQPEYMQGDVTGDGYINNKDLARLKAYLADDTVEMVVEAADVAGSNGVLDGYINNKDYARIKRYCADPEGVQFDK